MKVLDQLIFFGQLHGLTGDEAQKRAVAWARRMEIADALPKRTEELSKGMQQKIQFIATLLHDPRLIVMDEPFSGLGPGECVLVERTLLELKDQGKAILFSTHRMDQVEKLCDSICLINNGKAVLAGNLRQIKARYERNHVIVEFQEAPPSSTATRLRKRKTSPATPRSSLNQTATRRNCCMKLRPLRPSSASNWSSRRWKRFSIQTVGVNADA